MELFIILAVFNIFFLFYSLIAIIRSLRDDDWIRILHDPSFEKLFEIEHFPYIIENILKLFKINRNKFVSNMIWLYTQRDKNTIKRKSIISKYNTFTPSIKECSTIIHSLHMPDWFIAAFPEIYLWIKNDTIKIDKIDFTSMGGIEVIKRSIVNYLINVNRNLEVQTSSLDFGVVDM